MSILTRLTGFIRRSFGTTSPYDYGRSFISGPSTSGIAINEMVVLSASGVFAAIRNISEDFAITPEYTYRRIKPKGKELLDDHWLAKLLRKPNPEMSRIDFKQSMVGCSLLYGQSYATIQRTNGGRPCAMWPVEPWRVQLCRDAKGEKRLYYSVTNYGAAATRVELEDMITLKGLTLNGILGEMLMCHARDSFGLILGAEQFASRWFANSQNPSGFLKSAMNLTTEAAQEKVDQFVAANAGIRNTGKPGILTGPLDFVEFKGTNPEQSQLLQTRLFNLDEVCRWFRIPPFKIYSMGRATWGNGSQQALDYIGDTLSPHYARYEEQIADKLLGGDDSIYVKHEPDERLIRSDPLTRAQVQSLQLRMSIKNIDQIREENDDNPLPDGMGEKFYVPRDLITIDELSADAEAPASTLPAGEDQQTPDAEGNTSEEEAPADDSLGQRIAPLLEIHGRMLGDSIKKILHTETDKALRAAKRGELTPWATAFYPDHEQYVRSIIESPLTAFIESAIAISGDARLIESKDKLTSVIPDLAKRHVQDSLADLVDVSGLAQRLEGWMEYRVEPFVTAAMQEMMDVIKALTGETNG